MHACDLAFSAAKDSFRVGERQAVSIKLRTPASLSSQDPWPRRFEVETHGLLVKINGLIVPDPLRRFPNDQGRTDRSTQALPVMPSVARPAMTAGPDPLIAARPTARDDKVVALVRTPPGRRLLPGSKEAALLENAAIAPI
jgi:hypothetical protein